MNSRCYQHADLQSPPHIMKPLPFGLFRVLRLPREDRSARAWACPDIPGAVPSTSSKDKHPSIHFPSTRRMGKTGRAFHHQAAAALRWSGVLHTNNTARIPCTKPVHSGSLNYGTPRAVDPTPASSIVQSLMIRQAICFYKLFAA